MIPRTLTTVLAALLTVAGLFLAPAISAQDRSPFDLLIQDAPALDQQVGRVLDGTGNPWFQADIGAIAVACAEAGAAAISAINTMPALDIDTELEAPVLGNAFGGLSGPALLPIGLRCVLKAVRALRDAGHATPVIGIGGISSGEDAAKYLLCGAQAVQVGTSLGDNPERLGEIAAELGDWMERKGYTSLEQFRSNALEWLP